MRKYCTFLILTRRCLRIRRSPAPTPTSPLRLVQTIFYYHFATWMALTPRCWSAPSPALYLFKGSAWPTGSRSPRPGDVLFGLFGLVVVVVGPEGVGRWGNGTAVTMAFLLELIFIGYLLVENTGARSEKLAARWGSSRGSAPFVYKSVDWWRTVPPRRASCRRLFPRCGTSSFLHRTSC